MSGYFASLLTKPILQTMNLAWFFLSISSSEPPFSFCKELSYLHITPPAAVAMAKDMLTTAPLSRMVPLMEPQYQSSLPEEKVNQFFAR